MQTNTCEAVNLEHNNPSYEDKVTVTLRCQRALNEAFLRKCKEIDRRGAEVHKTIMRLFADGKLKKFII